jgi:homopolymeric O-antigen transport system permease protein
VYFPRVTLPGAVVCSSLLDFLVGFALLNILTAIWKLWHWQLIALAPLLMIIQACMALGIGMFLAVINAQYRDVKHGINFMVQLMLLATPVIYPISRLPDWAHKLAFLNPMAAVITSYRDCIRGGPFDWILIGLSLGMAILYLVVGFWFFRRRELRLVDIL